MAEFPDKNSTSFPLTSKNILLDIIKNEYDKKDYLKYHQFIVYKYLINNPKSRGILLFHEMGVGKSITAVALAEYYRVNDPSRKIIVLLSKSLQSNFKQNIEQFLNETGIADPKTIIEQNYKFISLNASNMFDQISRSEKSMEEIQIEKQLQKFTDIIVSSDFLENSVLIIDEYHNLSNSITNGSSNAIKLYDTIMHTTNIKLIFLTGTPIINSPFELAPTFNMLNGYLSDKGTLFPELEKNFNEFFINYSKNTINNAKKFQNRILGMVSYYGGLYTNNKQKPDFPKELKLIVEKIPMSPEQFTSYITARDYEIEEASIKHKKIAADRFSSKSTVISSYRVKSRQISNFLIPEYALGPMRGKKIREKFIDKINTSDLKNLSIFSPKIKKLLQNIKNYPNQLGLVYTEFVSGEGIAVLERILHVDGYTNFNNTLLKKFKGGFSDFDDKRNIIDIGIVNSVGDDASNNAGDDTGIDGGGLKPKCDTLKKTYAVITGNISFEDRSKIVKKFNNPENKHGKFISLLLISKTGSEGLDLKNIRHLHILEPFWNYGRISQIIARAVRYKSHTELPKNEQTVQPYLYLSNYPVDFNFAKKKEDTTDIELYLNSMKNKELIDKFYIALAEASVDCNIHSMNFDSDVSENINCHMCNPDNKPLYHNSVAKQILLSDPCHELKTSEIKAHGISIPGRSEKYMYSKTKDGKFHIYKYNEVIKGYTLLDTSDPVYSDILKKLLKLDK